MAIGVAPVVSRRRGSGCAGRPADRRKRSTHMTLRSSGTVSVTDRCRFSRPEKFSGCYGNIAVARLDERLAQQLDVVGRTAAAAGLGDEQRQLVVQIVFAAVQRVEELPDDEQRRVAGVVVDVFQAQLRDLAAAVAEHLGLVAARWPDAACMSRNWVTAACSESELYGSLPFPW